MGFDYICPACNGIGEWTVAYCNGSNGCSCHGQPVQMRTCFVCGGDGIIKKDSDIMANVKSIKGKCYLGSGPKLI